MKQAWVEQGWEARRNREGGRGSREGRESRGLACRPGACNGPSPRRRPTSRRRSRHGSARPDAPTSPQAKGSRQVAAPAALNLLPKVCSELSLLLPTRLVLAKHGVDRHGLLQQVVGKVHLLGHAAAVDLHGRRMCVSGCLCVCDPGRRGAMAGHPLAGSVGAARTGCHTVRLPGQLPGGLPQGQQARQASTQRPGRAPTWISIRWAFFCAMGTLRTCRRDKRGWGRVGVGG